MDKRSLPSNDGKLTIIVVNFNSGHFLKRCLESIENNKGTLDVKIIAVDNASNDKSIILAKKTKIADEYILNKENIGFGKANNQALEKLNTEFVLILNPDVEIKRGILEGMTDYMKQNLNVGAATCEIELSNGKIDLTAHRGFPTPWASLLYMLGNDALYHMSKKDMETIHEVDAITGAFFLTRKSVLDKAGFFDERFFMFAEDIDLCLRIKKAGYKVMYIPQFKVIHSKGVSTGLKKHSQDITSATLETRKKSLNDFYETMILFYKKHYEKKYPFFVNWLVYFGINFKWFLARRSLTV